MVSALGASLSWLRDTDEAGACMLSATHFYHGCVLGSSHSADHVRCGQLLL